MKRAVGWWLGAIGACIIAIGAFAPGAVASSNPPAIGEVAVEHVTGRGATLEATISTEGSKARYEFLLEWEEVTKRGVKVKKRTAAGGHLKASGTPTRVRVIPRFKLRENTEYKLIVAARSVWGETVAPTLEFKTS